MREVLQLPPTYNWGNWGAERESRGMAPGCWWHWHSVSGIYPQCFFGTDGKGWLIVGSGLHRGRVPVGWVPLEGTCRRWRNFSGVPMKNIANVFEIACLKDCFKPFAQILSFNSLITLRWALLLSHSLGEKKGIKRWSHLPRGYAASSSWGSKAAWARTFPLVTAPGSLTVQNLGGQRGDEIFRVSLGP